MFAVEFSLKVCIFLLLTQESIYTIEFRSLATTKEENNQNKEDTTIAQLPTHVKDHTHIAQWLLPHYLGKKTKSGNFTKHCMALSKLAYPSGTQ